MKWVAILLINNMCVITSALCYPPYVACTSWTQAWWAAQIPSPGLRPSVLPADGTNMKPSLEIFLDHEELPSWRLLSPPQEQPFLPSSSNKDNCGEPFLLPWAQWNQLRPPLNLHHSSTLPLPTHAWLPHALTGVIPRHYSITPAHKPVSCLLPESSTWDLPASGRKRKWSERKYNMGKKNNLFTGTFCFQNTCIWYSVFP